MLRLLALAALAAGLLGEALSPLAAQEKTDAKKPEDLAKAKQALQEVQDFVGLWNLEGTQKDAGKTVAWKEKMSWGWKFKDGDAWLVAQFAEGKGKYFTGGTLRYDVAKKKYVLALAGADKTEQVFEGDTGKLGGLHLTRKDAKTADVHKISLTTLAEGVRFQLKYEKQDAGKGLFASVFAMTGNKDGESIAGGVKKPECIVSGGAASISVSYRGKTYFVCCTGCRDEFNDNPAKYVNAKK